MRLDSDNAVWKWISVDVHNVRHHKYMDSSGAVENTFSLFLSFIPGYHIIRSNNLLTVQKWQKKTSWIAIIAKDFHAWKLKMWPHCRVYLKKGREISGALIFEEWTAGKNEANPKKAHKVTSREYARRCVLMWFDRQMSHVGASQWLHYWCVLMCKIKINYIKFQIAIHSECAKYNKIIF